MGGKSSNSGKKDEPTKGIPGTGPMMTQPAFIGDNQNMLAQQLAAGGYGQVPDLMSMLSQTFTPMQVLDTRPGAVGAPMPSSTSTNGGSGLASKYPQFGMLSNLFGQFGDGDFDLKDLFGGVGDRTRSGSGGMKNSYGDYRGNPPK